MELIFKHIGDAGFCGIALPENIMALSIAIRGKRHTYHKIAHQLIDRMLFMFERCHLSYK